MRGKGRIKRAGSREGTEGLIGEATGKPEHSDGSLALRNDRKEEEESNGKGSI